MNLPLVEETMKAIQGFCTNHGIVLDESMYAQMKEALQNQRAFEAVDSSSSQRLYILYKPDSIGCIVRVYDAHGEVLVTESAELGKMIREATHGGWLTSSQKIIWLGVAALTEWYRHKWDVVLPADVQEEVAEFWLKLNGDDIFTPWQDLRQVSIHGYNDMDHVVTVAGAHEQTREVNKLIKVATNFRWVRRGVVIDTTPPRSLYRTRRPRR